MKVKLIIDNEEVKLFKGSELAAGYDVKANKILAVYKGDKKISDEKLEKVQKGFLERGFIKLRPFERILFGTGITVADLEKDFEIQVRDRSGLSLKQGLKVFNSPGTIDADYRGKIGVILANLTPFLTTIEKNQRIAQLVFNKVYTPEIEYVTEKTTTKRDDKGYSSTGK